MRSAKRFLDGAFVAHKIDRSFVWGGFLTVRAGRGRYGRGWRACVWMTAHTKIEQQIQEAINTTAMECLARIVSFRKNESLQV